jgi:hypothetical protein
VVLYSLQIRFTPQITPYVIGGNMTGSSVAELISEFESSKQLRPDVAKPVWHNSLRLPKEKHCQPDSGRHSLTII